MPDTVKVHENAAGDVAIGVEREGVFVPLAQVPAHRIQHAVERRQQLEQRAGEKDEEARKVLASGFDPPKGVQPEGETEGGGS